MTSRPTCIPICQRSILSRSPLPPNAGSRSSRRTTLSSRLTVQISPPSSVLGSYYAKVGWRVYFDPHCPSVHSRTRGLPQLSTFLYTKCIDHLLATCCLSQHLRPSTLRTPRARACALSCSNSWPNSQHSPLHMFFSHAPWLSMASSGTPVHLALLTRSSGARWTSLGKCLSIHLLSRLANSTSSEVLTGWTCLHFVHGISTA